MDVIDKQISLILDWARKEVEGPIRGVPFLLSKLNGYTKLMH